MSCPTVTTIQKTECIGNSLVTINSNFATLKDAACDNFQQIQTLLNSFVGVVSYFPATTAPAGWLELNGSAVSRTTYSNLWTFANSSGNITATDASWFSLSAIGRFSPGDGSTTFRLPNLRGTFVRGSGTLNPSVASGGLGLYQVDAFKGHRHSYAFAQGSSGGIGNNYGGSGISDRSGNLGNLTELEQGGSPDGQRLAGFTANTGSTGSTETRPHNVALLPCIKY